MLKDYTDVKRNAEDREAWRAITRQLPSRAYIRR